MLPWIGVESPALREKMSDYYNCMMRLDEGVAGEDTAGDEGVSNPNQRPFVGRRKPSLVYGRDGDDAETKGAQPQGWLGIFKTACALLGIATGNASTNDSEALPSYRQIPDRLRYLLDVDHQAAEYF